MKKILALGILMASPLFAQASGWERRCGWMENPTPANYWLSDRDGSWTISVQGGYSARGIDNIAMDTGRDWVVTNAGEYGYGCACATVKTSAASMRILQIKNVKQQLLKTCLQDPNLGAPLSGD